MLTLFLCTNCNMENMGFSCQIHSDVWHLNNLCLYNSLFSKSLQPVCDSFLVWWDLWICFTAKLSCTGCMETGCRWFTEHENHWHFMYLEAMAAWPSGIYLSWKRVATSCSGSWCSLKQCFNISKGLYTLIVLEIGDGRKWSSLKNEDKKEGFWKLKMFVDALHSLHGICHWLCWVICCQ